MKIKPAKIIALFELLVSTGMFFLLASCEKKYTCSCTVIKTNKDTLMESVKTTKLGLKGFKETCRKYESEKLNSCHTD
jgi:hypothetical protein